MSAEASSLDDALEWDRGKALGGVVEMRGQFDGGEERSAPDESWLRALYDEHRDLIFRYAASRCGREAAADVVADTFVEVIRARAGYDPRRGSQEAWLLGIATNVIRRRRRVEGRYLPVADPAGDRSQVRLEGWDLDLVDAAERLDSQAQADEVRAALAGLSDSERSAFLLHAVEGMSAREVAVALGIGASAAKLRIFRARRKLRVALRHFETEAQP